MNENTNEQAEKDAMNMKMENQMTKHKSLHVITFSDTDQSRFEKAVNDFLDDTAVTVTQARYNVVQYMCDNVADALFVAVFEYYAFEKYSRKEESDWEYCNKQMEEAEEAYFESLGGLNDDF